MSLAGFHGLGRAISRAQRDLVGIETVDCGSQSGYSEWNTKLAGFRRSEWSIEATFRSQGLEASIKGIPCLAFQKLSFDIGSLMFHSMPKLIPTNSNPIRCVV
jgi:hypothetical protein